ncbi:MAG: hypothetical protein F2813_07510 [Actinobacteria bacterium]|uniref:Unannotated protein n=1 Tax=freshwater metagenome TaxID=449393 RepID=A0A6J6A551_9ZZZZ|nr:hypothetical protein [Actinomycetota bacterium]
MIRSQSVQLAAIFGAFVVGTLVALLLGAASLGSALVFGQMAFAAVLVWVLLKS